MVMCNAGTNSLQGCKRSLWKWSRSKIKIIPKKIKIITKMINIHPSKIKIIAKRSRSIKWSWSFRSISKIKITFLSVGCNIWHPQKFGPWLFGPSPPLTAVHLSCMQNLGIGSFYSDSGCNFSFIIWRIKILMLSKRHKLQFGQRSKWNSRQNRGPCAFVWGPKDTLLGIGMAINWSQKEEIKIKDQDQRSKIKRWEDQDQDQ